MNNKYQIQSFVGVRLSKDLVVLQISEYKP